MVILQDIATDSPVWLKLLDSGLTIFILSVGIVVLWKMWKQTQDKITNYNETDRKRAEDIIANQTIFDSTLGGFLDNARVKNWKLFLNPTDLLFIISELKISLGE